MCVCVCVGFVCLCACLWVWLNRRDILFLPILELTVQVFKWIIWHLHGINLRRRYIFFFLSSCKNTTGTIFKGRTVKWQTKFIFIYKKNWKNTQGRESTEEKNITGGKGKNSWEKSQGGSICGQKVLGRNVARSWSHSIPL